MTAAQMIDAENSVFVTSANHMHTDLMGVVINTCKAMPNVWQKMNEEQQQDFIDSIDKQIKARGLSARRVSLDELHGSIKSVEIVRHTTESGGILRFAILNLDNGFTVTGRPSVAVSPENDNDEVGVKVAIQNAVFELWPFMGFKVVQQRHEQQQMPYPI